MGLNVQKLKNIKMLVLDVDGVLTDARVWMDSDGQWKRIYSVRDGIGIRAIADAGYKLAIITGAQAADVRARAKMLSFDYFYEGFHDKWPALLKLNEESGINFTEMAYVGDDVFDIPLIKAVGFGATVPEAVDEVLEAAEYTTKRPGGNGAVREICDFILKHGFYAKTTIDKEI